MNNYILFDKLIIRVVTKSIFDVDTEAIVVSVGVVPYNQIYCNSNFFYL